MTKSIVLGGGCFWCLDPIFQKIPGVVNVLVGYAGGDKNDPSYRDVTSGTSGHAEVVRVEYNPKKVSLEKLLQIFFTVHDPTTLNQQGADIGTQYRSIILYEDTADMIVANRVIESLESSGAYSNPIVTQVVPLETFYKAEDYHQDYFNKNPEMAYCQLVIAPKMEKFNELQIFSPEK
jgi:peptide-methionine (S)-S-oxide reductase